jgi:tricorn protease-like protein
VNTFERLENELPMLLDELASPQTPDYLGDVFGRTVGSSQRPAMTFIGWWMPNSVLTSTIVGGRRLPIRLVALAMLILLAAALAGIVLVGSLRADLPMPYGVAGNGHVAYVTDWDIFIADPVTNTSRAITNGPDLERWPIFSPDGTHVAFSRVPAIEGGTSTYELVVADADGSNGRIVATVPLAYWSGFDDLIWSPDSRSLLLNMQASGELLIYDTMAPGPPRVLAHGVTDVVFRPPHGDQILFRRLDMSGTCLCVMNADGSDVRALISIPLGQTRGGDDLYGARWSPDGTQIVFNRTPTGQTDQQHLYVMEADGSNVRPLPMGDGVVYANNPVWSPDGTRIAFLRWDAEGMRPIGVVTLATGEVKSVGPELDNGARFDWSPDGKQILEVPHLADGDSGTTSLLAVDVETGQVRTLGTAPDQDDRVSWQRVKP